MDKSKMDFLIKIAHLGTKVPIKGVLKNSKVLDLMKKIESEIDIKVQNQILISKKGTRMLPEEKLSDVENEERFQSTLSMQQRDQLSQYFTIFVYDRKQFMKQSQNKTNEIDSNSLEKLFNEITEEDEKILIEAKLIKQDFKKSFKSSFKNSSCFEKLTDVNPDILTIEKQCFDQYSKVKTFYLQLRKCIKKNQEIMDKYQTQIQSIDMGFKYFNTNYSNLKVKVNQIQKRIVTNKTKNENLISRFNESIDMLSDIPIHPAFRTEKVQTLQDIYYKKDAMVSWKKQCIKSGKNLETRFDKIHQLRKHLKKKIRDKQKEITQNFSAKLQSLLENYQKHCTESEQYVFSLFIDIQDDYKQLRENMELLVESENDEVNKHALFFLSNLETLEEKIKNFKDYNRKCERMKQKTLQMYQNICTFKIPALKKVNASFKVCYEMTKESMSIENQKLVKFMKDVKKLEIDFSYLLNPSQLPKAYEESLKEISRRKHFNDLIFEKIECLNKIGEKENQKRKKFLGQYGRVLPQHFIPQLKDKPNIVGIKSRKKGGKQTDSSLPDIEAYHNKKAVIDDFRQLNVSIGINSNNYFKEKASERSPSPRQITKLKTELEQQKQISKSLRQQIQSNASEENQELKDEVKKLKQLLIKPEKEFDQFMPVQSSTINENSYLKKKIKSLQSLLKDNTKTAFSLFLQKLNNKQKKFDTIKKTYETQLMECEDNLMKQTQNAVKLQKNQSGKLKKALEDKNIERQKMLECFNKLKIQTTLLYKKGETIKELRNYKQNLEKEIQVLQKAKSKQNEQISSLQNELKEDQNKYENRISNKDIEIQKIKQIQTDNEKQISKLLNKLDAFGDLQKNINTIEKSCESVCKELENKFENAQITISKRQQEIEKLEDEINSLVKEKENVYSRNSLFEQKNSSLKSKLSLLQENYKIQNNEKSKLSAQFESKQRLIDRLQTKIKDFDKEVKVLSAEAQKASQLSVIQKSLKETQKELYMLKSDYQKIATQNEIKKADLDNRNKQIEMYKNELSQEQHKIQQLQKNQDKFKEEEEQSLEQNNRYLEKKDQKIKDLEDYNENLKVLNEQLQIENQCKDDANSDISIEIESLKEQNEQVQLELYNSKEEISNQENKIQDIEKQIEKKAGIIEELQKEIDEILSQSTDKEQNNNIKDDQIKKLNQKNKKQLVQIEELEQKLSDESKNHVSEKDNINKDLNQQEQLISEQKTQINQLQNDISQKETDKEAIDLHVKELTEQIFSLHETFEEKRKENQSEINQQAKKLKLLQEEEQTAKEEVQKLKREQIKTSKKLKDYNKWKMIQEQMVDKEVQMNIPKNDKFTEQTPIKLTSKETQKTPPKYSEKDTQMTPTKETSNKKTQQKLNSQDNSLSTIYFDQTEQGFQTITQSFQSPLNKQLKQMKQIDKKTIARFQTESVKGKSDSFNLSQLIQSNYIDVVELQPNHQYIFIPFAEGVYTPLILSQYNKENYDQKSQTLSKTDLSLLGGLEEVSNNFILDFSNQDEEIKEFLQSEISFILIAKVQKIEQIDTKDSSFRDDNIFNEQEKVYNIKAYPIQFALGFDDEQMILKNYL